MKRTIITFFLLGSLLSAPYAFAGDWSFGVDGGIAVPTQAYFPAYIGDAIGTGHPSVAPDGAVIDYQEPMNAGPGWMISAYALHRITSWLDAGLLYSYDNTGASAPEPFLPWQSMIVNGMVYRTGEVVGLGNIETNAVFAYTRIHQWTWGSWIPFLGLGLGVAWNTWMTPQYLVDDVQLQAHVSDAIATRLELGVDYALSDHFGLEFVAGGQINDPETEIVFPMNGTDQRMNLILFFAEAGVHFTL